MIEVETGPAVDRSAVRRIAVIRALQLGDMLVAVPAFRSLRAGFPDAEITLISLPWAESFVRRFSRYLDRFVPFAGWPGIGEVEVEPAHVAAFVREQRTQEYDLVIQLHGSGKASTPLALALGARATAGYFEERKPEGLGIGVPYPEAGPEIIRNLALVRLLGCPDTGADLEFPLYDEDRQEASQLLRPLGARQAAGRPLVGIHPGARPPSRRWSPDRFAALADSLARQFDASIILTGAPDEEEIAWPVEAQMRSPVLNLVGKTSLGGLAGVIDQLDLFISNDTGPAHLAVARDTPSVVLFGPADPARWAPLDRVRHPVVRRPVACSPCGYWSCPIDHRCLAWIDPREVMEVASRLLRQGVAA